MVVCGHSLECQEAGGGLLGGVDNALRAESSRHDSTTLVPSGGTAVPREVRLHPQEVRWYHPCIRRWYACEVPVLFYTEITSMTVVPHAGTRVVPL